MAEGVIPAERGRQRGFIMTDFPHGKHPNSLENLKPAAPEYGERKRTRTFTLSPQLLLALEDEAEFRGLSVSKTVEELLRESRYIKTWLE